MDNLPPAERRKVLAGVGKIAALVVAVAFLIGYVIYAAGKFPEKAVRTAPGQPTPEVEVVQPHATSSPVLLHSSKVIGQPIFSARKDSASPAATGAGEANPVPPLSGSATPLLLGGSKSATLIFPAGSPPPRPFSELKAPVPTATPSL